MGKKGLKNGTHAHSVGFFVLNMVRWLGPSHYLRANDFMMASTLSSKFWPLTIVG